MTLTPPAEQTYENAHMVGTVVPETVVKIVDPGTGKEVETGEVGEVLGKGPQITLGYLNYVQATRESYDEEGFLYTGDIGFFDKEKVGWLTITDRLKEMIKVKGVAVAPAELEDLLLGHELVVDVAVIGRPNDYAGELPKAFVVLKQGVKPSEETANVLQRFVQEKKSKNKWLAGGIEFIDAIPKSASEKIIRRMLRDQEKAKAQATKARL